MKRYETSFMVWDDNAQDLYTAFGMSKEDILDMFAKFAAEVLVGVNADEITSFPQIMETLSKHEDFGRFLAVSGMMHFAQNFVTCKEAFEQQEEENDE